MHHCNLLAGREPQESAPLQQAMLLAATGVSGSRLPPSQQLRYLRLSGSPSCGAPCAASSGALPQEGPLLPTPCGSPAGRTDLGRGEDEALGGAGRGEEGSSCSPPVSTGAPPQRTCQASEPAPCQGPAAASPFQPPSGKAMAPTHVAIKEAREKGKWGVVVEEEKEGPPSPTSPGPDREWQHVGTD